MNRLRELLDTISLGLEIFVDPHIPEADVDRYLSWSEQAGERAMCFWLGDMDSVCELNVPLELVRLPFKTCWFEGEAAASDNGTRAVIGLLATETPEGPHYGEVLVFVRHERRWMLMSGCSLDYGGGIGVSSDIPDVTSGAAYAMFALKAFCFAINCTNVIRREHAPASALQKAREKKGKAPLFSFWTLELNGRAEARPLLGGSHAGPRVHLVRGHPRQYAPGKWTWVQEFARGSKEKGMVHKDYAAGPKLVGPHSAASTPSAALTSSSVMSRQPKPCGMTWRRPISGT